MAHADPAAPQPSELAWLPSRKVATQFITNVLTTGASLLVTHFGLHLTTAQQGWVSGAIGIAAGFIAGYLVRELPQIEHDL